MIARSDQDIDTISGHDWLPNQTVDELHDAVSGGIRAGVVIPKNKPLLSVIRFEYYGIGGQWTLGVESFPGDPINAVGGLEPYYVYKTRGVVIWHKLRLEGRQRYRLTYNWGYVTIPEQVRDLSMHKTARKIIDFWGGQFGNQEINQELKTSLDATIRRLTWQSGIHRVGGGVG
jgi:hypothetical protein